MAAPAADAFAFASPRACSGGTESRSRRNGLRVAVEVVLAVVPRAAKRCNRAMASPPSPRTMAAGAASSTGATPYKRQLL